VQKENEPQSIRSPFGIETEDPVIAEKRQVRDTGADIGGAPILIVRLWRIGEGEAKGTLAIIALLVALAIGLLPTAIAIAYVVAHLQVVLP
jgi:hypothetical protein